MSLVNVFIANFVTNMTETIKKKEKFENTYWRDSYKAMKCDFYFVMPEAKNLKQKSVKKKGVLHLVAWT